jgi:hypothetical protein
MDIEKQIGIVLDVIFDIVEQDEPAEQKVKKILKYLDGNDRLNEAFGEFISWFKLEEGE